MLHPSDPVITGLFALGGVLVGGGVQGYVTHRGERRREGWAARKAARLFAPHLMRLALAQAEAREHGWPWADLAMVAEANLDNWESEVAPVLAGTLHFEDWNTVYAAVRKWQQMTHVVARDVSITSDDDEYLDSLLEPALEGALVLTGVGMHGPSRRRVRRALTRLRYRLKPEDDEELLEESGWSSSARPPEQSARTRHGEPGRP